MDDSTPLKGFSTKNNPSDVFLSQNPVVRQTGFLDSAGTSNRLSDLTKEEGIKLLDLTEVPLGAREKKRRKTMADAVEQQRKEEEAAKAVQAAAGPNPAPYTPKYVAGLVSPATPDGPISVASTKPGLPHTQTVSYVPTSTPRAPKQPTHIVSVSTKASIGTLQDTNSLQQQLQPQLGQSQIRTQTMLPNIGQTFHQAAANQNLASTVGQSLQPIKTQPLNNTQQLVTQQQQKKKALSLTREQMIEAQEMFNNSNKVTRPEKALILGFMAGSRENPCREQGSVLSIRLNEEKQVVPLTVETTKQMLVDTFFQMNYQTGDWKRVKKFREIEES